MTQSAPTPISTDEAGFDQAVFPLGYFTDFLEFLAANRDRVEVLTYADLDWAGDWDYERNYPGEWANWQASLRDGRRDPEKIYIFLQHDVDDAPERTEAVLREEERLGLPSCVMIFNRRLDRQLLQDSGEPREKPYIVDDAYLQRLEKKGWIVGYHSNAYEQSGFDKTQADEIFIRDVGELRDRFTIDFFCPHGGVRDADGKSNAVLEIPDTLRKSVRWVLNRHTLKFNGVYSDGAINSPRRDASKRDLREFVKTWKPGRRYRILTHPQYYHPVFGATQALAGVEWYEAMLAVYRDDPPRSAWSGIQIGNEEPQAMQVKSAAGVHASGEKVGVSGLSGRPIFIGGDGRSGTTLLNVVLDSHPLLAVGPELHFAGPVNLGPYILHCCDLIERKDPRTIGKALAENPDIKPGVQCVRRIQRAGFEIDDLKRLIPEAMQRTKSDLESFADRSVLVDLLGRLACERDGKSRYGFKIMREIRNVAKYAEVWPEAQFVHIIRDGRDVAASQMLEHGSWGYGDIEIAAKGWVSVIEEARASALGLSYHEIRYEDLVQDPEPALRALLSFLDVPWHDAVLRHEQEDHAFFHTHVRHPSRDAAKKPINTQAVGRFRNDLTPEQIAGFEAIALPKLRELGYPTA